MNEQHLWERYKKHLCSCPAIGLTLDISRMTFADDFLSRMEPEMQRAFLAMQKTESGAIANPDESRMVGHYWLRSPEIAPSPEISIEIGRTFSSIAKFAAAVHAGRIKPRKTKRFSHLLCIGIGGSALGPQFASDALASSSDRMQVHFLDNTDPDGFDRVLSSIGPDLSSTLTLVISKSGGTTETRNGMLETMSAYKRAGLDFSKHAVAITGVGSHLFNQAETDGWLSIFPMWDWVGGRTSITSAVGLLPMALQGVNIASFLDGARNCDIATRLHDTSQNPAALLALMWYHATGGKGRKDMVLLPYKDRLQLFSKYLQQLIMESLGKEKDLDGKTVNQGIAVYGNKGTTDQHAYVQQLREGVNNFFVTFIQVLKDRQGRSPAVAKGTTSGDYLASFLQGTRDALSENNRESITLTVEQLDARSLGVLIALYERAVGFYASLVNINPYHQPGVEAGKKMAGSVIELQRLALELLAKEPNKLFSAEELATTLGRNDRAEILYKILEHAAANPDHRVRKHAAAKPYDARFSLLR